MIGLDVVELFRAVDELRDSSHSVEENEAIPLL
jgi:hypothetical protein